MEPRRFQQIIDYNLDEEEVKAFKLALMWGELTRKMFPKEKGVSRLGNSDPRKSTIFRFCWKLLRETRGLLRFDEYKLYMTANLTMIKVKNLHLSPNILCGDSAWIRWKIWKKLYDQKVLEKAGESQPVTLEINPKIVREFELTKRFLFEKCDGEPSIEKLQEFLDNKSLNLWAGNKICFMYLVLSPWIRTIAPIKLLEREMSFDSALYESKANDNVRAYFEQVFSYEF